MIDLGPQHFISIEDVIEQIIHALHHKQPWSITRWADSSNMMLKHHGLELPVELNGEPVVHRYRGGVLTHRYFPEYVQAFLHGAQTCDVLGVFVNDEWTTDVMNKLPLDLAGKPLVYAWANKFLHSRREYVEEVFERPWRTALVGNRMPEFAKWLDEHFPKLQIIQCNPAGDWPDVKQAMAQFAETKPELLLASAGWFTSPLVGAAKDIGAVAVSCGHLPDWWMYEPPYFPPNTEFPRGIAGSDAHMAKYYKAGCIHQVRDIVLEGDETCSS